MNEPLYSKATYNEACKLSLLKAYFSTDYNKENQPTFQIKYRCEK